MNLSELKIFHFDMGAAAKVVRDELLSSISCLLHAGLTKAAAQINFSHLPTSCQVPQHTGSLWQLGNLTSLPQAFIIAKIHLLLQWAMEHA